MAETVQAKLYKSNMPSMKYVFTDGREAVFRAGRFSTIEKVQQDELDAEIVKGLPFVYVDKEEATADAGEQNLLAGLRDKIIAEYLAAQTAATDKSRDMGESDATGKLNMANSGTVADAAAGSDSVGAETAAVSGSAVKVNLPSKA